MYPGMTVSYFPTPTFSLGHYKLLLSVTDPDELITCHSAEHSSFWMSPSQIQEDNTDHYMPKMSSLPGLECKPAPLSLEAHCGSCCPESQLLRTGWFYSAIFAQRRDWVFPFTPVCLHMELSSKTMPSFSTLPSPKTPVISYPRVNVEMPFPNSQDSWCDLIRLPQCSLVVLVVFWYISPNLGHSTLAMVRLSSDKGSGL